MLQYQQVMCATVVCFCLIEAHRFSRKEGESISMRAHPISLYRVKKAVSHKAMLHYRYLLKLL